MRNNILKLLNYKGIFVGLVSAFNIISCTTTTVAEKVTLKTVSPYELSSENKDKAFMLRRDDLNDINHPSGFIWQPFVLPQQNFTLTNAGLFLTYIDSSSSAEISPPKEGGCSLLSTNTQTSKQYTFINRISQKRMNTSLYFILDAETHEPVAIGRLNHSGRSECMLPEKPFAISVGYGRYRREIHMDGKSKLIKLNFPKVAALRVIPNVSENLKTGDTIRIGRKFDLNTYAQTQKSYSELHIDAKITPDLYLPANMTSRDFSIDEYMKTSFLIGTSRFQIELEPATYVVAVIRKTKILCVKKMVLKPDSALNFSCNTLNFNRSKEDIAYQFASEDTTFDVGFRLKNMIRDQSFVEWSVSTPGSILLGPPEKNQNMKFDDEYNENDFFSLVFKNSQNGPIVHTGYGASFSESISAFKIPLYGMSKENLVEGQVPFADYVFATSRKYTVPYFLNYTNVMHTNGAEITVLEPTLTNNGILFATSEQGFMIRLFVPPWNSTHLLEMYVNDTLAKRWVVNRGNIAQPISLTLKGNAYESKNFIVKFVARGDAPLSNFLTGRDSYFPYAETREFCVSIDGKDQCK